MAPITQDACRSAQSPSPPPRNPPDPRLRRRPSGAPPQRPASSRRTRGPSAPLRLDVGELVVHPIPRVARRDNALLALRAPAALLRGHREGAVDRIGLLLDVERIDRECELGELLVRPG